MSGQKMAGNSPIRRLVRNKFPQSRIVEEQESPPVQPDASPLAPDRVTPQTRQLYEKFFGPSASSSGKAGEAVPTPSSENVHPLSDQEGGVLVETLAPPGRRLIKEQVLVSGGKIVALSD
jgi:hypothetical protein